MTAPFKGKSLIMPLVIAGLGAMTVASAQDVVSSPFAKKTKKQAWETDDHIPAAPAPQAPSTPVTSPYASPNRTIGPYDAPVTNPLQESAQRQIESTTYNYQPKSAPVYGSPTYNDDVMAGAAPAMQPQITVSDEPYYSGRESREAAPAPQNYSPPPYARPASGPMSKPQRSGGWRSKLGLDNLKTTLRGFFRGGAAATEADGWRDDYIGEVNVELGASAITQGGMEYGFSFETRAQYDRYRKGFGGRVGDCPPGVTGCAFTLVDGTPTALRGHTSQFYTAGIGEIEDLEIAVEGAYVFLRSAYGDVTLGRDDGAAYLFSLGAPTLMAVNASNSPMDYTGLDSVKTVNDASGFSEKVTYTSPRLLGDQIGFGVQLGASYAFNARACGVDYCVRRNGADGSGTLAPDLKDVMEVGLSVDRKFDNGLKVEATATYATAKNEIAIAGFDDLQAWNTGLEVSLGDWTAGASYLQSNNALSNGDYVAYDAGITWKPSAYGFSASYGHADDKSINLESDQFVFGVTREFNKFTLGTGVQYIERTTPFATGGVVASQKEKATALFIEGGFKF